MMSSAVCAAHRYCWPRLAKLPVSGSTEPMSTSVTFGCAGATVETPRAAATTTARTLRRTARRRIRSLQAGGAWVLGSSGPLSYQIDRGRDLARDAAGRKAPRREIRELRDGQVGAGHHDRDVVGALHDGQRAGRLVDPRRPLAHRLPQPPSLPLDHGHTRFGVQPPADVVLARALGGQPA